MDEIIVKFHINQEKQIFDNETLFINLLSSLLVFQLFSILIWHFSVIKNNSSYCKTEIFKFCEIFR